MANDTSRIRVWVQAFPDRPNLMLQWHDPDTGRRKSRSAKTDDQATAANMAKDLETDLNRGTHKPSTRMAWEDFCDLYAEEKRAGNRLATQERARCVLESFGERCHPKSLGAVNERMVSQYATAMRVAKRRPATIQGHLAYLKAALRWAVKQKLLTELPAIDMPKVPKKSIIRTVTMEEFERLLDKCPDDQWRALLWTAWYTGMRRTEMFDLTWHDGGAPWVDFGQARIWIPAAYNKADADQWLPLHPELARILGPMRQARGRIFALASHPSAMSLVFCRIAKLAAVKATMHDLRRTFGSRYAATVPAPVLQRLMRHSDIKTTMRFYTNVDKFLEEAILKA
jgi:integrase